MARAAERWRNMRGIGTFEGHDQEARDRSFDGLEMSVLGAASTRGRWLSLNRKRAVRLNLPLGAYVGERITFRHWISVDIKYSLPIQKRLYPSHYSLLYFVKGDKPAIFHPDRLPVPCCRHCGGELRDYGGYKSKMNPMGVSLTDVWTDIPPVRHAKHKKRGANGLALKLMDRIVSMASDPGSLVLDPFGGSGTTYVAAELTGRRWIGSELDCTAIIDRFSAIEGDRAHLADIQGNKNVLFTRDDLKRRRKFGKPLPAECRVRSDPAAHCDCEPLAYEQPKRLIEAL